MDPNHQLTALQPKLKEATIATDALIETVKHNTVDANEQKAFVQVEEAKCGEQAASAGAMKADCEKDLAEAIPALEGAITALKTLSKSDIVEVKAMKKPPPGVKLTMTAVCMMFMIMPNMVKVSRIQVQSLAQMYTNTHYCLAAFCTLIL